MTTISIRRCAVGTLAIVAIAGVAVAQTSSPILNTLEVRKLVSDAEPADHARLVGHFAALADRHIAEARRHGTMAASFAGNPSRNLGAGMTEHCRRLEKLNTDSATTLSELANHHRALAAGDVSASPRDGVRFQNGAEAREPTEAELKALAASAVTPADYRALAEYFVMLAKRHTAEADDHAAIAHSYRGTRIAQAAVHCDRIVADARESAREAIAAAAMYEQFAQLPR